MNESARQLVEEIKQISEQYIHEVGSGGYRVWPKSIKDRVLLLCDLVGSTKETAELCGLSKETIYQWRAEIKKSQFKSLAVVESKKKSVPVTAAASVFEEAQKKAPIATVTVTTPRGFSIGGLGLEEALLLLKQLGGL